MKTKLTVTLKKSVIETAKKRARAKGISLSRMIEQIFEESERDTAITETGKAAQRLLARLAQTKYTQTKQDDELISAHVKKKFT